MAKERIRMQNAPDWYDTPLDELHFEWSAEEKLEIERYCEKIHKNIEEEEMTPRERWIATQEGKEKDRCFMATAPFNVYAVRTLDSNADAFKADRWIQKSQIAGKAALCLYGPLQSGLDFPVYNRLYGRSVGGQF